MTHHLGAKLWVIHPGTTGETYEIIGVDPTAHSYILKGETSNHEFNMSVAEVDLLIGTKTELTDA